jgi:23S rRNA pseudouridine1911/1915/1917 synthase
LRFEAQRPERVDRFLARSLPGHSRTKLARMIGDGLVLVDGLAVKPSFMLLPGMAVALDDPVDSPPHDLERADIPLTIVFEDEAFLVVDKPRGLAVHPASSLKEPSLVNALLGRGGSLSTIAGEFRPGIVHRLDKDTTGLLAVAKTDSAHAALASQFESKSAERRYFALVAGAFDQDKFIIEAPIGRDKRDRQRMAVDSKGKAARTEVYVVRRLDAGSLLALRLTTGRTHQIRVHLRAVGHPVLGDAVYAPREMQTMPLQLHAAYLELDHPTSGKRLNFYSEPPDDFVGREFCSREAVADWVR